MHVRTDRRAPQKLLYLLSRRQRHAAAILLCLMLVGMVLETLGISLVLPVITVLSSANLTSEFPWLEPWLLWFGNPTHEELIIGSMLTLVVVYMGKALFLAFLAWSSARFSFGIQEDLSSRLFSGYLRQSYVFHLQRNSAELIRNTIRQVDQIRSVMQVSLTLVAEIFVLLGISVLLLVVEPVGTLWVAGTLSLAGLGFQALTRDHLLSWGQARQMHEGLRIQHLQQGLGGVKDARLLGREENFVAQYGRHNTENARLGRNQATLQKFPRIWFELLAVLGLTVLILVLISRGQSLEALLPTLGLFTAAAFRLLPSLTSVLASVQALRTNLPVIENLHHEFKLLEIASPAQDNQPVVFQGSISLEEVKFRYPDADTYALKGVSLSIPRGSNVGFIGTTGSGKSTLVDIVLGLLTPNSGVVRVDGLDIQKRLRGWQDQIGYVPQSIFLTDDTLRRNVALGLFDEEIDESAVKRAVHSAQLDTFIDELPDGLDTVVGERGVRLSGGQRQRIGIARALYHDPGILVLDEATSALDTVTESQVMAAVNALKNDKTIVIVAHRLSTVEHCERIFRLEKGKIVDEGEVSAILGTHSPNE